MVSREWIKDALTRHKTVLVDDIDIAYQEFGSGDPLLMIMGYALSMDCWPYELLQKLSISNRLILFDNRGMGHSQSSDKKYSIPLFACDTIGLLDKLGTGKVNVLGCSMGTYIAQEIALTHPEKVNKLILVSGSVGGKEAIPRTAQGLDALTNRSGTPEEKMKRLCMAMFPLEWLQQHPDPFDSAPNPEDRISRQFQAIANWAGSFHRLDKLNCPTLIITGDSDLIVPGENSMILARGIANSWLIRIRQGGHGVIGQYPDLIAEEISLFLRAEC